jgi:hypothetical protein
MKTATDWFALAKEILPLAKAGNAEAQYVLFKTITNCQSRFGAKYDSENAARDFARSIGVPADQAAAGFQQCHGFATPAAQSLGNRWDWLQQATDAGYAPAQAQTAAERLSQDQLKAARRAGGSPTDEAGTLSPIGGDADPRVLLQAAALSGDPEVLMQIGDLQYALHPRESPDTWRVNEAAWVYAGCQREGTGCKEYGPTTMTNCSPNTASCTPVPQVFMRWFNNNWAPVQDRVDQINAALSQQQGIQWDQLGLGTGGS